MNTIYKLVNKHDFHVYQHTNTISLRDFSMQDVCVCVCVCVCVGVCKTI